MKKTYKITLPKGANISTVETNDNNGVLEVTIGFEQEYVPKDGDVVDITQNYKGRQYCFTGIFKEISTNTSAFWARVYAYVGKSDDKLNFIDDADDKISILGNDIRPATEAEKQRLFDALAKHGKRWNPETKRIEDLPRWRAGCNKTYLYITSQCYIIGERECNACIDNYRYAIGNYFRTREAAEKVAEQIREIYKNSKAE